ncbi:hypothetical protein ACFFNY_28260 [Paenibacillus hodogayensis]|uniref:Tetratricopeptide repeat protein n=1 Tax=Paenibacillus hodogayensis TaxID=279208 RepID=A0ABV5W4I6_9BACL
MLKQLFATMNDALEDIVRLYPTADVQGKQDLHKKLDVLKSMSDSFIEHWLHFEEKLSRFLESMPQADNGEQAIPGETAVPNAASEAAPAQEPSLELDEASETFKKGQGYFQLLMYDNAIREFAKAVEQQPDFLLARLYLAMGHMRLGNDVEAYRHFRLITSMTEQHQMKAISYNAMGCIQAKNANMEQAQQLFKLAYTADPSSVEPMINMGICMSQNGSVKLSGPGFIH